MALHLLPVDKADRQRECSLLLLFIGYIGTRARTTVTDCVYLGFLWTPPNRISRLIGESLSLIIIGANEFLVFFYATATETTKSIIITYRMQTSVGAVDCGAII